MALLASQVLDEAVEAIGTADALAARMEPHLEKRYGDSAIYAYTNKRAVPPGDVLLAATLAAGISIDEKLGIGREPSEVERQMEELRAQMSHLSGEVADLRGQLAGRDEVPPGRQDTAADAAAAESGRAAQRREWARRSAGSPPESPTTPGMGPAGRPRRP